MCFVKATVIIKHRNKPIYEYYDTERYADYLLKSLRALSAKS
jgi:hypothetical protein